MTDKVLDEYYQKHKSMYMSLADNCTSVPEILLKIEIYGKKWNKWDWVLLLSCIISRLTLSSINWKAEEIDVSKQVILYRDIIDAIDNASSLDQIFINKEVILNIIYVINNSRISIMSRNLKIELCTLLAHVFKKFPMLWNMSWMFAKYKNPSLKKWTKYHRLRTSVYMTLDKKFDDPYYRSKKYFNDFLRLYLPKDPSESE